MASTVEVAGDAIFKGKQVLLRLQQSQTKEDPEVVVLKPMPDDKKILAEIQNGTIQCHPSRLPITAHEVRTLMRNIQLGMQLRPPAGPWSDGAHSRFLDLLNIPKRKRGRKCEMIANGDGTPLALDG